MAKFASRYEATVQNYSSFETVHNNFVLKHLYWSVIDSLLYAKFFSSQEHTYINLTPLNPTFIYIVKLGLTGV